MPVAYQLRGRLWRYPGKAAWHFITLPKRQAKEIRALFGGDGTWGSIAVQATVGATTWRTSIFPDARAGSYLLPVKAQVRQAEALQDGAMVRFRLLLAA